LTQKEYYITLDGLHEVIYLAISGPDPPTDLLRHHKMQSSSTGGRKHVHIETLERHIVGRKIKFITT
jgi:hypothetical protein